MCCGKTPVEMCKANTINQHHVTFLSTALECRVHLRHGNQDKKPWVDKVVRSEITLHVVFSIIIVLNIKQLPRNFTTHLKIVAFRVGSPEGTTFALCSASIWKNVGDKVSLQGVLSADISSANMTYTRRVPMAWWIIHSRALRKINTGAVGQSEGPWRHALVSVLITNFYTGYRHNCHSADGIDDDKLYWDKTRVGTTAETISVPISVPEVIYFTHILYFRRPGDRHYLTGKRLSYFLRIFSTWTRSRYLCIFLEIQYSKRDVLLLTYSGSAGALFNFVR